MAGELLAPVIGIDLGTTFSVAAVASGENARIVPNKDGKRLTPSIVAISANGFCVGPEAEQMLLAGAKDVARLFKPQIADESWYFFEGAVRRNARELSSDVLRYLLESVREAEPTVTAKAVISVPAYFGDLERRATIQAGVDAGLDVLGIINEPTAAALAGRIDQRIEIGEKFIVYDLGGGTFDVTIAVRTSDAFDVVSVDGDRRLGGYDWDACLAEYLAEKCAQSTGFDPRTDVQAGNELMIIAEQAKRALSSLGRTKIEMVTPRGRFAHLLTAAEFEQITEHLVVTTVTLCERALAAVGLSWSDMKAVVPVGGSTRLVAVRRKLEELSGKTLERGVNPDEAVALGAARYAVQLATVRAHPAEGVALRRHRDATAHSLGMVAISNDGERFINSVVIPKNSTIPSTGTRNFTVQTWQGQVSQVEVYVLQGEEEAPSACRILRKYILEAVEFEGDGKSVVEVAFGYDCNNQVDVTGRQMSTGKSLPVRAEPVEDDISWMDRHPLLRFPPQPARPRRVPRQIVFAIDLSGSMAGKPVAAAAQAAQKWAETLDFAHDSVAVIEFADNVAVTQPATSEMSHLAKCFARWTPGSVGYGNSAHPFDTAAGLFHGAGSQRTIIVLTDGMWSCREAALQAAKKCHAMGIEVKALGFGSADQKFLEELASAPGDAHMTSLQSLEKSLLQIAQEMNKGTALHAGTGADQNAVRKAGQ